MCILSVVIATKNRAQYCFESVKTMCTYAALDLEIVIQDNSDDDALYSLLKDDTFNYVKYFYNSTPLSIIDNFNAAIANSTGKYLCLIGDDDIILPNIIEVVQYMERNHIDTICSSEIVDYVWPNLLLPRKTNGVMRLPSYNGSVFEINVQEQLFQLVRNGIFEYQVYNLPRLYHGIVTKECLETVKYITGNYLGGLTPDIYATISLSCVIKKHVVISYPFTIAGACPASASVANLLGKHSGSLQNAPHFKHRLNYVWDQQIPAYYSVDTIWAETAIKAIKEMKKTELLSQFNIYKFLVLSIYSNRSFILSLSVKTTLRMFKYLEISPFLYGIKLGFTFLAISIKKCLSFIRRILFGNRKSLFTEYKNVANLQLAKNIVMSEIGLIKF